MQHGKQNGSALMPLIYEHNNNIWDGHAKTVHCTITLTYTMRMDSNYDIYKHVHNFSMYNHRLQSS